MAENAITAGRQVNERKEIEGENPSWPAAGHASPVRKREVFAPISRPLAVVWPRRHDAANG